MNEVQKILIVGGGIAGLTAAVALRRANFEVDVAEINPQWSVTGVGITLMGNALRALDTIGLAGKCVDAGYPINAFRFYDDQGNFIGETPQAKIADPKYPASCGVTRPRMHAILQDAVRKSGATVRLGLSVATIKQTDEKAMVTFSDGTSAQYDLVIGSDGYRSAIRSLVFGSEYQPTYSGQVCWRCNVPRLAEVTELLLFNGKEFKAGLLPLAPDLMYILMTETPPAGSPTRYAQDQLVDVFRERLSAFGGAVAQVRDHFLNASSNVVLRPFEVIFMPTPWYRGRVVLIGDAAHSMTPHVVQGGATAIEDAIVLAEELATQVPLSDALDHFMQRRYARDKAMFDMSLQIGKWEQDHNPNADPVGLTARSFEIAATPI